MSVTFTVTLSDRDARIIANRAWTGAGIPGGSANHILNTILRQMPKVPQPLDLVQLGDIGPVRRVLELTDTYVLLTCGEDNLNTQKIPSKDFLVNWGVIG